MQADVESQGKTGKPKLDKSKAVFRSAAGQKWWDPTLTEWAENDFRIFVGDMGNEVNDDILTKAFTKYASFQKAKIVRDKHSNKSKGRGWHEFLHVHNNLRTHCCAWCIGSDVDGCANMLKTMFTRTAIVRSSLV